MVVMVVGEGEGEGKGRMGVLVSIARPESLSNKCEELER